MPFIKMIKLGGISVIAFFLLLAAFSALLPAHVRISRAVNIAASPARVTALLGNCTRWPQWNAYIQSLPEKSVTANSIQSKQLTVTITASDTTVTTTTWRQANGKTFPGVFSLTGQGAFTVVQWYFDFHFRWYPWEKFSSIVYDKQLGPMMQESLGKLKQEAEKN